MNHYFWGKLPCKIFLNNALSIEVRCGTIRLISSGILGPTNNVSSVKGIAELARSRAILDFTLDPVSSLASGNSSATGYPTFNFTLSKAPFRDFPVFFALELPFSLPLRTPATQAIIFLNFCVQELAMAPCTGCCL